MQSIKNLHITRIKVKKFKAKTDKIKFFVYQVAAD